MTSGPHLLLHSSVETQCLTGVLATLPRLSLSPSHRNDRIGCDIVLVTVLIFSPCHLSQLLTPAGRTCCQWPPQCRATGQFWPSSSTSQRNLRALARACFALTWWWPGHGHIHPDDCLWFFSFEPLSSHYPYLAYRMLLLFFCISFEQSVWTPHQCLAGEAVSKSESAMFPLDEPESEGCLVSSILWAACGHLIIRIG